MSLGTRQGGRLVITGNFKVIHTAPDGSDPITWSESVDFTAAGYQGVALVTSAPERLLCGHPAGGGGVDTLDSDGNVTSARTFPASPDPLGLSFDGTNLYCLNNDVPPGNPSPQVWTWTPSFDTTTDGAAGTPTHIDYGGPSAPGGTASIAGISNTRALIVSIDEPGRAWLMTIGANQVAVELALPTDAAWGGVAGQIGYVDDAHIWIPYGDNNIRRFSLV